MNTLQLCVTFIVIALQPVLSSQFCRHENNSLVHVFQTMPVINAPQRRSRHLRDIPEESCPAEPEDSSLGELFVNDNSLCSWNYTLNQDPNRYPHDILEAQCACRTCINGIYRCMPIIHEHPVVRQECRDGTYYYYWVMEPIAVGCACSHAKTRFRKRSFPALLQL
ncbi:interleukin-17F-like [Gigantopelta aegis]|uniref:interleukin-17F-like n=1 Tax=Gigantopelta aegis TaxID=1735272 RepID=UPI001B887585|nr:interleukin-17F-like [Gigantopelta aegis]